MNTGSKISNIYLKHPGNESSEDEEGEEETAEACEEQKEAEANQSVHKFFNMHKKVQDMKKLEATPSTSKN